MLKKKLVDFGKCLISPSRSSESVRLQRRIFWESQNGAAICQSDFPVRIRLPKKFGCGLPERVVELLLARLHYESGAEVLDVGHANAMLCHLELIKSLPVPHNITGIDIAQPVFNVSSYYKDSIYGDIMDTDFGDDRFDLIWCISALEHFGMDNSGYTNDFSRDSAHASKALCEMLRIVKPKGQILVTVPFGKYEDHGWFVNYDKKHWQDLLSSVRFQADIKEWYFRHTFGGGWAVVEASELMYVGYYDQANSGGAGLAVATITKSQRHETRVTDR